MYDSVRKVQVKGHVAYYIAPFVVVVFYNSVQCLVRHSPCAHDYFKYTYIFRRCSFVIKRIYAYTSRHAH